jgi:hypothetical protein
MVKFAPPEKIHSIEISEAWPQLVIFASPPPRPKRLATPLFMTGGEWHRREKGCVKKSWVRKRSRKTFRKTQK